MGKDIGIHYVNFFGGAALGLGAALVICRVWHG